MGVTGGPANLDLARFAIRQSSKLPQWMAEHGVTGSGRWQAPCTWGEPIAGFSAAEKRSSTRTMILARKMGIDVRYDACVEDLLIENGSVRSGDCRTRGDNQEFIRVRAVVVAAGGYEANIEWLKRHWGEAADNFLIRGTPYNDGRCWRRCFQEAPGRWAIPKGFTPSPWMRARPNLTAVL